MDLVCGQVGVAELAFGVGTPCVRPGLRQQALVELFPAQAIVGDDGLVGDAEGGADGGEPEGGVVGEGGRGEGGTGRGQGEKGGDVEVGGYEEEDIEGEVGEGGCHAGGRCWLVVSMLERSSICCLPVMLLMLVSLSGARRDRVQEIRSFYAGLE